MIYAEKIDCQIRDEITSNWPKDTKRKHVPLSSCKFYHLLYRIFTIYQNKIYFCNVIWGIPNHFLHLGCKIFKIFKSQVYIRLFGINRILTERKLCRFTSQKVSFICYMMTLIKVKKETPTDKCWTADSQTNVRQSVHCNTRQIVCTWELFFERLEKHSKLCKLYIHIFKKCCFPQRRLRKSNVNVMVNDVKGLTI